MKPIRIEIREDTKGETLILSIDGELDISTIPQVAQRVEDRIGDSKALILDLSGLTFMDSSGLRLLIDLNQHAQREGWAISFVRSKHESANLVLRITGADAALPFAEPLHR